MLATMLDKVLAVEGIDGWMMISKIPDTVSRRCDLCGEPFADVQVIDWHMRTIAVHWKCVEQKEGE